MILCRRRIISVPSVHWGVYACALLWFATNAAADQSKAVHSHCKRSERVVFSCELEEGNKIASICSSSAVSAPKGYIQYRFGKLKAPEMKFPVQAKHWEKEFTATHYFRSRVDRRELSFSNDGFRYTIFSSYEGEESPAVIRAGIIVGKDSDAAGKVMYCKQPFIDNLHALDAVIVPDVGP